MNNKYFDIVIIGAGAAGLTLASLLKNRSLCILDANSTIGAKIKVSGGGKCNITNRHMSSSFFDGDSRFVSDILGDLSPKKVIEIFTSSGANISLQEKIVKGQYFCKSSNEVIEHLKRSTKETRVELNCKVEKVVKSNTNFIIYTSNGEFTSKQLVVASGGLSYPALNATDIGFKIAEEFKHTITPTKPALVGFTLQPEQFWLKELSGISIIAKAQVSQKILTGSLLFAHRGVTGPLILNCSLYWNKGSVRLDFLPNIEIKKALKDKNKQIISQLNLPKNFSKAFLMHIGIDDKVVSKITQDEWQKLESINNYEFAPAGTFGYTKAEATKGGVNTDEIDSTNMQSKLVSELYFIGEVLDVTGELGGYNLHWAFASAHRCAKALAHSCPTN